MASAAGARGGQAGSADEVGELQRGMAGGLAAYQFTAQGLAIGLVPDGDRSGDRLGQDVELFVSEESLLIGQDVEPAEAGGRGAGQRGEGRDDRVHQVVVQSRDGAGRTGGSFAAIQSELLSVNTGAFR
ncbi:hypothetical protein AB0E04_41265 [Streptomyces sp. NPDC048251]|uniref:hypothetical protein n=1 Tax=Streptomyces sp. NPDC048251 TaxID=3154501 RepID=UPI0034462013